MEDGGVDTTVIKDVGSTRRAKWQNFLLFYLLQFLIFKNIVYLKIKSQTMVNLLNTILFQKYVFGPIIEIEHLWVCTKFMCLHIPISLVLAENYLYQAFVRSENCRPKFFKKNKDTLLC